MLICKLRKKSFLILGLVLLTVAFDQGTKQAILWIFHQGGSPVVLTSFLSLVSVWNKGISFGLFGKEPISPNIIISFSLIFCLFLFLWAYRERSGLCTMALSFILGGALGNIVDRYFYGAVFDFIDCHWGVHHWPAFNIADTAIVIGVGLLFWKVLLKKNG